MIKIFKYNSILLLGLLLFISCHKDEPSTYSGSEYLEFDYTSDIQQVTSAYSTFYYKDSTVKYDTVYFAVHALGVVPTKTSYIKFKAYKDTSASPAYPDAVAGVHYIPFDDANMMAQMKMEAGEVSASVPVILKRDKSLKDSVYQLLFTIDYSDDFLPGNAKHILGAVYISDKLSQPSNWTSSFFLGTYGPVKHQFIIEQSGERWDAAFISTLTGNTSLQSYYLFKFTQALKTVNAERIAEGLTELREDPSSPSSAVTFPSL
ncbi:MAG: DUF4843 domain-containing protein [Arachidicoccus sp.]|nr:DUF4843 domain-containing protein [Arachidicoccus sp.]